MDNTKTFKSLPAVLATRRTYTLSDATFYNIFEGKDRTPVDVIRHGVRATNNSKPKKDGDGVVSENDVRNLQTVDTAKLDPQAKAYQVEYQIAFFDLATTLSSVAGENSDDLKASLDAFIERAKNGEGISEVSRRYARNILNGRWLWRNRLTARNIDIEVSQDGERVATASALDLPLSDFNGYHAAELRLGEKIQDALKGDCEDGFVVRATVTGKAQGAVEVFPSQNYQDGDNKNAPSRSLYVLNKSRRVNTSEGPAFIGHAAIRDQKVANAIRTIDTWYPSEEASPRPIAIEQYGANLDAQRFYRNKGKSDAYHLMGQLNVLGENTPEAMFMIACLVRGAVYAGG